MAAAAVDAVAESEGELSQNMESRKTPQEEIIANIEVIEAPAEEITCTICSDVYTDAKNLSCGHVFCLGCLEAARTRVCPECKENSIPDSDKLKELPSDDTKNRMVGETMMKRVKVSCHQPLQGAARNDAAALMNIEHVGAQCSNCERKDFTGCRYVCGICPSYNLCDDCEEKPSAHNHDKTHIFVKLKRAPAQPVPEGPILEDTAKAMGEAMVDDRKEHMVLEELRKGVYKKLQSVYCSRCGTLTGNIVGVRYKCGNCKDYDLCQTCEKRSDIVHNPKHAFLVIKHPVNKIFQHEESTPLLKHNMF